MARYYRRRSPLAWIAGFAAAVFTFVLGAHLLYRWLLPLLPLAGSLLLVSILMSVAFRRRR